MSISPRLHLMILLCIVAVSFSPVLSNGFTGDDNVLFLHNSFYYEDRDVRALFSRSYNLDAAYVEAVNPVNKGSGSVAYRPVLSLTYMLDAAIFGKDPFGFHLTNYSIHLLNAGVLFVVLLRLFSLPVAFWGALFFGVHPLNVEAVASVGYRADLLAGLFVMIAVLFWVRSLRNGGVYLLVSWGAYLLAVFSKESAFLAPVLLWGIERVWGSAKRSINRYYIGFILIGAFYLFCYFCLFPNRTLAVGVPWPGEGVLKVLFINGEILRQYMGGYLWPASVRLVPGLYYPLSGSFSWMFSLLSWVIIIGLLIRMARGLFLKKGHSILLLWAFLSWLPASNLVANVNPMAHRFLYLPLAGLAPLAALAFLKLFDLPSVKRWFPSVKRIGLCFYAGVCCLTSFPNSRFWSNDLVLSANMVRYYPDHFKGHEGLGVEYFNVGQFDMAAKHFEIALRDPRLHLPTVPYLLGSAYLNMGDLGSAAFYFRQLVARKPGYAQGYDGLADYYYKKGDGRLEALLRKKSLSIRSKRF